MPIPFCVLVICNLLLGHSRTASHLLPVTSIFIHLWQWHLHISKTPVFLMSIGEGPKSEFASLMTFFNPLLSSILRHPITYFCWLLFLSELFCFDLFLSCISFGSQLVILRLYSWITKKVCLVGVGDNMWWQSQNLGHSWAGQVSYPL